ncbi:SIS domain-containing protein [Acidicapsa ligni]|uniref:SIS domain-containing protein n=1 Tax=Acidicapsa ligni TaxID=542300 RepID=UPI0021E0F9C4|nr:SIS domain-containing protein [Acidicapsa ligni]
MRQFPHAMLREIYEQPDAIRRTLAMYVEGTSLKAEAWAPVAAWANAGGEVLIAASGSSRHSGLCAEVTLEDLSGLAVDVEYASEYSCRGSEETRHPSVIVISQSGETSDTLAALREAQSRGQRTLAITNVATSSMAREATVSLPLGAGKEFAIPATKSFTCQLVVLYLLALNEGLRRGSLSEATVAAHLAELQALPDQLDAQLEAWEKDIEALAHKYRNASTFLYLGRGVHYPIAREGALKLKEASYVHAEGYPSGELKHGPNALVSDRVPVVIVATVDRNLEASRVRYEKTLQLLADLQTQGATVIAVANTGDADVARLVSDCIYVEPLSEHIFPVSEVIPFQIFSYFMALEHGVDVDRPRNLSKAVIEA